MGNVVSFRKARKYETFTKTYVLDSAQFEFVNVLTEADIVAAVKRARDTNVGIRAMGSKFSWERIIEPP